MLNHNVYSDLIFFRPWHQASRVKQEHLEFHSLLSANSMRVHQLQTELRCFLYDSYSSGIGSLFPGSILFSIREAGTVTLF
jgi:hypothetical protein